MTINKQDFLAISKQDMLDRDWYWYDFLIICGDAYVDHPSFGSVVIARCLESKGYRVAYLAQPDFKSPAAILDMGKPRLGVFIGAGNLDSMVANYSVNKKRRKEDSYSPGKKAGLRPDYATIVYSKLVREAFGDIPIIIGGLEASLRRFAHYDYWSDQVKPSILVESKADILVYGMGETASLAIAERLKKKLPLTDLADILGIAYLSKSKEQALKDKAILLPSYKQVCQDKKAYALATKIEYQEHDYVRGQALIQPHNQQYLIVNPPQPPLSSEQLDAVFALPYTKEVHPIYETQGGVAAIEEVRFSLIHNRGCFGACNFCALAFHQGRAITARSHDSLVKEAQAMIGHPLFKGYINDVGGPTANFRQPSCAKQAKQGLCKDRKCLAPNPCKHLNADHRDYLKLLRRLRNLDGVKKVFIRSGIRYDYLLCSKDKEFFAELVKHHISGQLKVAPEHCIDRVLGYMGKPQIDVYERFIGQYQALNTKYQKEQYLVPYLMSSHPGSRLIDAVNLAEYLRKKNTQPEQVQDFYPTPGTISTAMYYSGLDPLTMQPVYSAKTIKEKAMQRALLQWKKPNNRALIIQALKETNREDLIGNGKNCLLKPYKIPDKKR